jgi:hypothetical protein
MLLIGFIGGGLVAALTVALMCEDMVVAAMDEADELRAELNEPIVNRVTIEVGVGYDENDNVWKL